MRVRTLFALLLAVLLAAPPGPLPARAAAAGPRVAIQAGHWRASEAPSPYNLQTGGSVNGVDEWAVNLEVARRVVALLGARGVDAELLPAWFPSGYAADAFVALHANGAADRSLRGFFADRAEDSVIPAVEDRLVGLIDRVYSEMTPVPFVYRPTCNSRRYYAFYRVTGRTPAAMVEMGFLTNDSDRAFLTGSPQTAAEALATAVIRFLNGDPAPGPVPRPAAKAPCTGSSPSEADGAPAQSPSADPSGGRVVRDTGGCLRVRETPSLSGRVLTCLPEGTRVTVAEGQETADGHTWLRLEGAGWAAAEYLASLESAPPAPPPAAPAPTSEDSGWAAVATGGGCLNVRAAPGLAARVLDCLVDGTTVALTGEKAEADGHTWRRIQNRGWAAADYLKLLDGSGA